MSWRCRSDWMVPPRACDASGDKDTQAEEHCQATGHPTESWPLRPDAPPLIRIKTSTPPQPGGVSHSGEQ